VTTQTSHLPAIDDIEAFFSNLLGTDVSVTPCEDLNDSDITIFGDYTDSDNATHHFVACDIEGAAVLTAALTGFPASVVEEAVASGELPDNLFENLQEILNIAVNLFPQSRNHRIVIDEIIRGADAVAKYEACSGTPEIRFNVSLRQGGGKLIIGAS